jgi:hypothetical protein
MEQDKQIQVHFSDRNDKAPAGKLASAEIRFMTGPMEGLRLVGFTIWARNAGGRNVTFPSRQYVLNGQKRSFDLLRPLRDDGAQHRLRERILSEFDAHQSPGGGAPATPAAPDYPDLPRP